MSDWETIGRRLSKEPDLLIWSIHSKIIAAAETFAVVPDLYKIFFMTRLNSQSSTCVCRQNTITSLCYSSGNFVSS